MKQKFLLLHFDYLPVGKTVKNSLKECVFVNSALKVQCHIIILGILSTGRSVHHGEVANVIAVGKFYN